MKKQIILILSAILLCGCANNTNDVQENSSSDMQTSQAATINVEETTMDFVPLSEDEYKAQCKEMFYDDIFFGKDDLENKYVKLHLLLSEKYYFTNNDYAKDSFKKYNEKYNLNRDFYKCCVLRQDTNSYVGHQINMWFSNDTELNPNNYKTGQKIVVYAKVVNWSNNTMSGHNSVTIIPRFIEEE